MPKNYPVAEPTKAPIQLSEGRWFEPTYGFYLFFELFQFLKDYHSISAKKRNRNSHEKWIFMHLSTYLIHLQNKGGLLRAHDLVLLSEIECIYAFNDPLWLKSTKNYLNCPKYNSLIIYIRNYEKNIKVKQNIE